MMSLRWCNKILIYLNHVTCKLVIGGAAECEGLDNLGNIKQEAFMKYVLILFLISAVEQEAYVVSFYFLNSEDCGRHLSR